MINENAARKYCKEDISKIKNYDLAIADTTQIWECHHMTETWWNCSRKDLIENECYYDRKACELIFLTRAEHNRLHKAGIHLSEESRKKMSEAHKGKTHSEETRRKLSEAKKGENNPLFGRRHSEETRRKMSEAQKGEKNHFFGKHHSEETCNKISEAHKGKSSPMKGKHHSDETRIKLSEYMKGRTFSEETRRKMSESAKRRCAATRCLRR